MSISTLGDFVARNGPVLAPLRLLGSALRVAAHRANTLRWRLMGLRVGDGSIIEPGVYIGRPRDVSVGRGCRVLRGVAIIAELNGGKLTLGDRVAINHGVRLDHTGDLIIEDDVTISHDAVVYTHSHGLDPHSRPLPKPLLIGKGAWIGGRAMIMAGMGTIGARAIVAAGAIVTKAVEEATVVGGNPAKPIRRI